MVACQGPSCFWATELYSCACLLRGVCEIDYCCLIPSTPGYLAKWGEEGDLSPSHLLMKVIRLLFVCGSSASSARVVRVEVTYYQDLPLCLLKRCL